MAGRVGLLGRVDGGLVAVEELLVAVVLGRLGAALLGACLRGQVLGHFERALLVHEVGYPLSALGGIVAWLFSYLFGRRQVESARVEVGRLVQ